VRFAYEWREDSGNWFRSYGNENWEFDEHGLIADASPASNDAPIQESERKYHWPLGRRPTIILPCPISTFRERPRRIRIPPVSLRDGAAGRHYSMNSHVTRRRPAKGSRRTRAYR